MSTWFLWPVGGVVLLVIVGYIYFSAKHTPQPTPPSERKTDRLK